MKDEPDESESIVSIDEHALDKECVRLPSQYRQAAYNAAETNRDIDELKRELKVVDAEVCLRVRKEPTKYGLDKITEGALKEMVTLNPKVRELEGKIAALEHKVAMQKALCSALDMKKRSLTNLVELHSAGYHAEVRPSAAGRDHLKTVSQQRLSKPLPWKARQKEKDDND